MSYPTLYQIQSKLTMQWNDILNKSEKSQHYPNKTEIRSKLNTVTSKIKGIDRYIKTHKTRYTIMNIKGVCNNCNDFYRYAIGNDC